MRNLVLTFLSPTFKLMMGLVALVAYSVVGASGGTTGGSGDGGGRTVEVPKMTVEQYTGKARTLLPAPDLTGRSSPIQAQPEPPAAPYPFQNEPHILIGTGQNRGSVAAIYTNYTRCVTAGAAFMAANPNARPNYSCTAQ